MCKWGPPFAVLKHPLQPSNSPSHLITPVSASGHPLPRQRAAAPFINHTQPAIAAEWCSAGVEKHRGRANSLNNSRLAVITDEGDRLWFLFALAAVGRADTPARTLRTTPLVICLLVTPSGFSTSVFTCKVT